MPSDLDLPQASPLVRLADGRSLEGFAVPEDEAFMWWQRLADDADELGRWPVLTNEESLRFFADSPLPEEPFEERLARSHKFNVPAQMAANFENALANEPDTRDEILRFLSGKVPWPEVPDRDIQTEVLVGLQSSEPIVLLVPVAAHWMVPCFMGYGSWNGYPSPAKHSAQLRYLERRYGARLVGLTSDTVGLHVSRPPLTRYEAVQTAFEFLSYNEYQGYGSGLVDVAASLLGNPFWIGWWD